MSDKDILPDSSYGTQWLRKSGYWDSNLEAWVEWEKLQIRPTNEDQIDGDPMSEQMDQDQFGGE